MPQMFEEVHIWDVGQAANKARSLLAKLHPSHCERAFYPSRVLAWAQCKFRMYKSASFIHICTKLLQYKAVNLQKQEHMCRRYVDEDRAMPTLYDMLWDRSCQQWHVRFSDRRLVRVSCPPCFCLYFLPTVFVLFCPFAHPVCTCTCATHPVSAFCPFAHRVCTFSPIITWCPLETCLPTWQGHLLSCLGTAKKSIKKYISKFQNQRISSQWQTQYRFDIEVNLLFWEEKCDH